MDLLSLWPIVLPIVIIVAMHMYEMTETEVGNIYPNDLSNLMSSSRRIQIFSFQSKGSYETCRLKGAIHIDIMETDPDAFYMMLKKKKYPVLCYCDDGQQSKRYFQHIQRNHKSFWLVGGLDEAYDQVTKYCVHKPVETE